MTLQEQTELRLAELKEMQKYSRMQFWLIMGYVGFFLIMSLVMVLN